MNCKNIDRYIIKYCEKTLSPMEQKKLFEHLISCEECMESFNCCVELYEQKGQIENNELPMDFTKSLMNKIDIVAKKEDKKKLKKDRFRNSFSVTVSLIITFFALLIVHKNIIKEVLIKNDYLVMNKAVDTCNLFFNNISLYAVDIVDIFFANILLIKFVFVSAILLFLFAHKKLNA